MGKKLHKEEDMEYEMMLVQDWSPKKKKPVAKKVKKAISRTSKVKELDAKVLELNKQYDAKKARTHSTKAKSATKKAKKLHKEEEMEDEMMLVQDWSPKKKKPVAKKVKKAISRTSKVKELDAKVLQL